MKQIDFKDRKERYKKACNKMLLIIPLLKESKWRISDKLEKNVGP